MQTAAEAHKPTPGFYKTLLVLALPIVLQNLIDSAVSTADTVMLGYVSQSALSATSLANNVQFIFNMFLYGICSGSSVLISQYWGRKDIQTIERTIGISLRFTLCVGIFFSSFAICLPGVLMRIYSPEADIIALGSTYLRIVGIGFLTGAFTQVYISSQRSMERVLFGMVVNMVSLLLNVLLNACFIFGIWFFPELGIVGVAIATAISRIAAFLICAVDSTRAHTARVRIANIFAKNKELFKDFVKYTLPALGNDFAWGLGFSMYSVILGHLGQDAVAANSYAQVTRSLGTVICFALANAAAIIMGKTMGENRLKDAEVYAKRFTVLSIVTGLLAGVAVAVASPFILRFVRVTDAAREYLRFMLLISVPNVLGQSVNTMLICGVFRAGGDTRFGFLLDTVVMWGYGVAIGAFAAFVLKLPVPWVYGILFFDEMVKMPFVFINNRKRKWLKNITRDLSAQE